MRLKVKVQCEILLGAMRTGQVDLDTLDPDQATLVQDVLEAKGQTNINCLNNNFQKFMDSHKNAL